MKVNEVKSILNKINLAYPYCFKNISNDKKSGILNLWIDKLQEINFEKANKILDKFIVTSQFAPTISDFIQINNGKYKSREYTEEYLESFYDNV